jgi:hypothetical protein
MINPGIEYKIQAEDLCIYLGEVEEETFNWKDHKHQNSN